MKKLLLALLTLTVFVGCSTTTKFTIPKDTTLFIEGQELSSEQVVEYKRNPFFWNVAKGIPYRLERDGKTIDEGRLKSSFRVVSVFWTPAAVIYWPLGFQKGGYDFTKTQETIRPSKDYVTVNHRK
ncbi:hypothetical protein A9Q84_11055 [Halobacteriovorax marinus]|uniref:Lipoprotein n=1 Tax=Halobacteriovorax marinus TaxID=97084 RepID=A0A1Y5F7G8_9BACT|nr:hypothetical protein A9Q84_11055 [Halobacteriovorax marinus]